MYKQTLSLFLAILCISPISCDKFPDSGSSEEREGYPMVSISATEPYGTKTVFNGSDILWEAGDSIGVFSGSASYALQTSKSGSSVTFQGFLPKQASYLCLFPYDMNSSSASSIITSSIPSIQYPVKNSFGKRANVAAALSSSSSDISMHTAAFHNVGSYLKLTVGSSDYNISEIQISAIGGENIAGNISISIPDASNITASGGSLPSVILRPSVGDTFEQGDYYAVLLPVANLSQGLRLTLKYLDETQENYDFENITGLQRNAITTISNPLGSNFWNTWTDAASLKALLLKAQAKGKVYTSQHKYYDYTSRDNINNSRFTTYGGYPLIYGIDFGTMSGTFYPEDTRNTHKTNIQKIVKQAWKTTRSIPSCSWHLESPYASSSISGLTNPFRYCYQNRETYTSFPTEHRYQVNEILNNTGSAVTGQTCGDWFDDRVREVADVINSFVDEQGNRIPIIFRLWHEIEDYWAWWQIHDIQDSKYKDFYQLTVNKFRTYCPDAIILFVYCTDRDYAADADKYMANYPGNGYVDIMGYDDYSIGKADNIDATIARAAVVCSLATANGKISALCETLKSADADDPSQAVFFQDFVEPIFAASTTSLSIFQVWGGADNTANRKISFQNWYSSETTIFNR